MGTPLPDARGRIQRPMQAVFEQLQTVDIRRYELADAPCLAAELRPVVLDLVTAACAVLDLALEACEDATVLPDADDPPVPRRKSRAIEQLEEIAFVARLELRQRSGLLASLDPHDRENLLAECDCTLQRVRKALTATDAAIAEAAGIPPVLELRSVLETSLAIRRAYASLRARILAEGPPTPQALHARMRGARTAIAVMTGWDVYPSLRIRDRLLVRNLQERIGQWLQGEPDEAAGLRLWQDLAGSLEMLALVSQRPELIEHDREVARRTLRVLRARVGEDEPLPAECIAALHSLTGLDAELDALLARPNRAHRPQACWMPVIERLARRLGPGGR